MENEPQAITKLLAKMRFPTQCPVVDMGDGNYAVVKPGTEDRRLLDITVKNAGPYKRLLTVCIVGDGGSVTVAVGLASPYLSKLYSYMEVVRWQETHINVFGNK